METQTETELEISKPQNSQSPLQLSNNTIFPSLPSKQQNTIASTWKPMINSSNSISSKNTNFTPSNSKSKTNTCERFNIPLNSQAKRQLGSSISDTCKSTMLKFNTTIELSTNKPTGTLTLIITGSPSNVQLSKRSLLSQLTLHITQVIPFPASLRSFLIGKGGANLKALTSKTLTKINITKPSANDSNDLENSVDPETISITGDSEGVSMAKAEILALVAARESKLSVKLIIEKSYHPFIFGQISTLESETGARIHIPPSNENQQSNKVRDQDEIAISGDKDSVLLAESRIKSIYEELKRTVRSVTFPVKKRQHRFIIGQKAVNLNEIFQKTGCIIHVPPMDDPTETITIRGPDHMLTMALQSVLEKANSVIIADINISDLVPKSLDCDLYLKYLFMRLKTDLKTLEIENNINIIKPAVLSDGSSSPILEIQGNSKAETDAGISALSNLVKLHGKSMFISECDIPSDLHRFIVGKGGQNIMKIKTKPEFNGRLMDIVVPNEESASTKVLIIVHRMPFKDESELQASDLEAKQVATHILDNLIEEATISADYVSFSLAVDSKYHSRLIGAGGSALKEMLGPFSETVYVKFPNGSDKKILDSNGKELPKDAILIKGQKSEVSAVAEKVKSLVSEWKKMDILTSFNESISLELGTVSRLFHQAKGEISGYLPYYSYSWIIRGVKESVSKKPKILQTIESDKSGIYNSNYNLRIEILPASAKGEIVSVSGPKIIVPIAVEVIKARAQKIIDTVTESFSIFDEIKSIQSLLTQDPEMKDRIMRRLIGKEGKKIKLFTEKYGITMKFSKGKAFDENESPSTESPSPETAEFSIGDVKIKGLNTDVEDAKRELLEMVEAEALKGFILTFQIPSISLSRVVGRGGSKIAKLKEQFSVRVDSEDNGELVNIILEGIMENVMKVKDLILETVDDACNLETMLLSIPYQLHKQLIGPSGNTVKELIESLGGTQKVNIQFPKVGSEKNDEITIQANSSLMSNIQNGIDKILCEFLNINADTKDSFSIIELSKSGVEEILTIPHGDIGRIFGRGGEGLIDAMKRFSVGIWIVENSSNTGSAAKIRIVGYSEAQVEKAKQYIMEKMQISTSLQIPNKLFSKIVAGSCDTEMLILSDMSKKVKKEYNVSVDTSMLAVSSGFLHLLGSKKHVAQAVGAITKKLHDIEKCEYIESREIETQFCSHIIGRSGERLKKIRNLSGATIDIYRADTTKPGQLVVLANSHESLDKAFKMVDEIIADQLKRFKKKELSEEILTQTEPVGHTEMVKENLTSNEGFPPGYSGKMDNSKRAQNNSFSDTTSNGTYVAAAPKKVSNNWNAVISKKTKKNMQAVETVPNNENNERKNEMEMEKKIIDSKLAEPKVVPTKILPITLQNPTIGQLIIEAPKMTSTIEVAADNQWQTIKGGKIVILDDTEVSKKKKKKKTKKPKAEMPLIEVN